MVMRPKSIATVVSALRDRVESVMSFSVERTVISLIVRISVVLPAENGPVTTILTAVPPCLRRPGVRVLTSYNPLTPAMSRSSKLLFTDGSRSMRPAWPGTGAGAVSGFSAWAPSTAPTEVLAEGEPDAVTDAGAEAFGDDASGASAGSGSS